MARPNEIILQAHLLILGRTEILDQTKDEYGEDAAEEEETPGVGAQAPVPLFTVHCKTLHIPFPFSGLINRLLMLSKSFQFRRFSQAAAAAAILHPDVEPSFTYLEGFPTPDPKFAHTIIAAPRPSSGSNMSAKERKAGRVPSILFEQEDGQHGGNKRLISVRTNQIRNLVNNIGRSFFLSRLFDLEVRSEFDSEDIIEKVRVLPRQLHLHAGTDRPLNVTFIRAPPHAMLKVNIPLLYSGEDVSPGLRKGSYLNTIKRTVKFLCPAEIIPPYIEVDLSELDVGQKLVMGDLKVHPALKLLKSKDEPICKIMGARVSEQQKKSK